ncbi:integrase core domain protein [Eremococcus coleocola ACS-139-V-Col8]|uniref:Integrase core domain protein n=10 Tax=Eremococcus TaxID=171412 RepID=E4KNR6_9LACT|nr:integrase core domain protein [Eremococcus coleocola ACS-139-V-Col8]
MYWQAKWKQADPDAELKEEMLAIRQQHPCYGYRRMHAELINREWKVNCKKVQRIYQELGLQIKHFSRKYRKYNSYKGVVGRIKPNRINRRFNTSIVHQKITTDTSEFKFYELDSQGRTQIKKLYLDPFLDMCNLEIISYKITSQPNGISMLEALREAIEVTADCSYRRIFHSDQGWAYQMPAYQALLKENQIFQSMSRKGNCYDNAPMENFFSVMKQEMYYDKIYHSYRELETAIIKYIQYYNAERIKEKLNWMSPIAYRHSLQAA